MPEVVGVERSRFLHVERWQGRASVRLLVVAASAVVAAGLLQLPQEPASAAVDARAVSPTELPPIPSDPAAPDVLDVPEGDSALDPAALSGAPAGVSVPAGALQPRPGQGGDGEVAVTEEALVADGARVVRREETFDVLEAADGTQTALISAGPRNVRVGEQFVPIETDVVRRGDALAARRHPLAPRFADRAGTVPLRLSVPGGGELTAQLLDDQTGDAPTGGPALDEPGEDVASPARETDPAPEQNGAVAELPAGPLPGQPDDGDRARAPPTLRAVAPVDPVVRDDEVRFPHVLDGTDLIYEVTPGGVKETVRLANRRAAARAGGSWTYRVGLSDGLSLQPGELDDVVVVDGKGQVRLVVPAVLAWDSSGIEGQRGPAETGGRLTVDRDEAGWLLTVSVDPRWLADPAREYPVLVDPGYFAATGATTTSTYNDSNNLRYKSDGYVSSDPQLRTGNPNQKDGTFYWQSTTQFNYSNLWSGANAAHGVDVVDAYVGVLYDGGGDDVARPMRLFQARPGGASGEAFNNYLPTTLAEGTFVYDGVLDGVATADGGDRLVQHLQQQVDARQVARLHFVGDEKPNVYSFKRFDAQLVVQWTDRSPQAPAASTATPGDGTYAQLRPTLRVGQVSDPEGDEVRYRFYVASGADGRTGTVAVSRWLTTPEWEVPPGVIRDGMPLRWTVSVSDWRGGLRHSRTAPWAKEYFVDQRVGSPDVAPVDSNGAWSVTLPNGNAHTTLSGPAMNQIGGPVAMTMTYNSQRDRRVVGLTGTYWEAAAGSAPGAPPADPSLVRQETSTVLDWGTSSPLPGVLAADGFRLRLTGFLTVPAGMSGQWLFGGYADDRLRVRVAQQNGALATAYDRWSFLAGGPHFQPDKPITLTAGQTYAIEVDYAEDGGGASLQLWADPPGASPPMVIPSTWLSPERPRALPSGWTLSTEIDGDPGYVSATPVAGGVAVLDGTGETHTWVATTLPAGLASSGQVAAYTPPKGQDGVLAQNADGTLTLHDADGTTFSFGADGRLTASATALEDRLPRTPQRILDGQGRLTELREPNENQWILRLRYQGGTTACPSASGFTTPPTGMLCKIDYRDGRSTEVFYDSSGRLTRVINPGSQVTDVGYENIQVRPGEVRSVMTSVRDPLTSDWVARDPANRTGPETRNVVAYSAAPGGTLALGTDQPVANVNRAVLGRAGEGRQIHRYGWQASGTTGTSRVYVEVDGLQPLPGQRARTVDYDPAGRPVRDIEATGRATTLRWDDRDRLLSTTDPAGRRTTTVYDRLDQPLETYGPAPTSCFTGDSLTPTASCASTIPRTSTAYDQGISGLAARYWNNPDQQGVPDERGTGVNRGGARTNTTPTMSHDWGAGAPAGITADRWSARWTGEITFPSTGTWRAVVAADDGVRVTVGDRVVFDRLKTTVGTSKVGPDFVVDTDPRTATTRRITVDYRDTGGAASFGLQFAKPGDGSTAFTPGAATSTGGLSARYGLPTTVTTYGTGSGGDAPDQTVRTVYDEPHTGLPSDVVEDPGGLALRTQTFYDALRRPVAREMPAHQGRPAGTGMAYRHAWVSRTVDDPCVTGTQDITQHGLPRYAFGPARNPDATSALQVRRVDETVYDSAGRVRATRTGEHTGVVPSDSSTSSDTIRTQTSWHGWLCTTYDDRDRPTRMTVPTNTSGIGTRIITTDYAVDGDPLRISTTDPRGTIRVELDVLGRTRSYTDVHGTVTTSDYDQPGRLVTSRTQPPSGTAATHTFAYDPAGRPTTHRYAAGGATRTLSTTSYNTAGEVSGVTYGNGTSLGQITRDSAGRGTGQRWSFTSGSAITESTARARDGRMLSTTVTDPAGTTGTSTYRYDKTGRLTRAALPRRTLTYAFDATSTTSGCPIGTRSDAGRNTNRTSVTVSVNNNLATTTRYCYDGADRLLAATGAQPMTASTVVYDQRGNTTRLGNQQLGYDGTDRNTSMSAGSTTVDYSRDATDRITRRAATGEPTIRYSYSGPGDTPDLVLSTTGQVLERQISLAGGVLLTLRPSSETWAHTNLHDDVLTTSNATGARTAGAARWYEPHGNPYNPATGLLLDPDTAPDTSTGDADHTWLGQHQRLHEHAGTINLFNMGARPYDPTTGRFLRVDPIEGGSANNYEYADADPINSVDLDGLWSLKKALRATGRWAWRNKGTIALTAAGFVPGVGGIVWGVRTVRAVQGIRNARYRTKAAWRAASYVSRPGSRASRTVGKIVNRGTYPSARSSFAAHYAKWGAGQYTTRGYLQLLRRFQTRNLGKPGRRPYGRMDESGRRVYSAGWPRR